MRKIQNDNITFRVTTDLKKRLTDYCLENDCHNSVVLRQALAFYLKGQRETETSLRIAPASKPSGRERRSESSKEELREY